MPCCCPPTLIAATPPMGSSSACAVAWAYAVSSAAHQSPGICSLTGGVTTACGDRATADDATGVEITDLDLGGLC